MKWCVILQVIVSHLTVKMCDMDHDTVNKATIYTYIYAFNGLKLFSRPYWVVRSRLWYDVLSVCRLSVCNVLYCG